MIVFALIQAVTAVRLWQRILRTRSGSRVAEVAIPNADRVSVLVPVLNEFNRLAPCLNGLIMQGPEVTEILVIDGGSADGTRELVQEFSGVDARIRLIDAAVPPSGVNGKAVQLQAGLDQVSAASAWVLTIDADLRPAPALVTSLLAHAQKEGVSVLSAATRQRLSGAIDALLHASMLTTLVYRFGIPGLATRRVAEVQANGQCFLVRRELLSDTSFAGVSDVIAEDVALARKLADQGNRVGFYEAGSLATVEMYANWQEIWQNWPRSLPLRDHQTRWTSLIALGEMTTTQALPLVVLPILISRYGRNHPVTMLNVALVATRVGVLAGTARAYETVPITYWLSPLADLPVALRLWQSAFTRNHTWRGRVINQGVHRAK